MTDTSAARLRRKGAAAIGALMLTTSLAASALASEGSGGIDTGGGTPGGTEPTTADGQFPVRGRHTYGDGLGAGRGHQGQDLLAKCGKAVVAAQPGRVQVNEYQSAAGNYVVIDGAGKLEDTAYMHLQRPSALREGQRVAAGDLVGRVGDTGRASACNLHFEIWSNPGWYEGGEPVDPEPSLRLWDRSD